jgi:alkanesulfonate monooxygenase SsuD/methylene tetrahydromethanopterin reductase-like flavin-dependent oxidoreductase (luciferase family)
MLGVAGAPFDAAFLEPWTALAALAREVPSLRLGVLVCGVTYRHPSMLAKIASSLDAISGGRVDVGLGAAWSHEDHYAYGIEFPELRERLERLEEAAELICGLWTHERFSFSGKHYALRDAPLEPRPVQPRAPLLLAGASPRLLRLTARLAQQWVSVSTAAFAGECVRAIEAHCARIGRDPQEIEFAQSTAFLLSDSPAEVERALAARAIPVGNGVPGTAQARTALPGESAQDRARGAILAGDAAQVRAQIQRYVDGGVTHFILQTPPPLDAAQLERFRREVVPAFA